jgi:hypothetical protein
MEGDGTHRLCHLCLYENPLSTTLTMQAGDGAGQGRCLSAGCGRGAAGSALHTPQLGRTAGEPLWSSYRPNLPRQHFRLAAALHRAHRAQQPSRSSNTIKHRQLACYWVSAQTIVSSMAERVIHMRLCRSTSYWQTRSLQQLEQRRPPHVQTLQWHALTLPPCTRYVQHASQLHAQKHLHTIATALLVSVACCQHRMSSLPGDDGQRTGKAEVC